MFLAHTFLLIHTVQVQQMEIINAHLAETYALEGELSHLFVQKKLVSALKAFTMKHAFSELNKYIKNIRWLIINLFNW